MKGERDRFVGPRPSRIAPLRMNALCRFDGFCQRSLASALLEFVKLQVGQLNVQYFFCFTALTPVFATDNIREESQSILDRLERGTRRRIWYDFLLRFDVISTASMPHIFCYMNSLFLFDNPLSPWFRLLSLAMPAHLPLSSLYHLNH